MLNPRAVMLAAMLVSGLPLIPPLAAQTTDAPYLSQFPTVEQVKKAMVVADPRETALRQMGAFWQLQEIIKQLSGRREFRGFTPDEDKIVTAYYRAAYYIGVAIDSAYPGPYGQEKTVSGNHPYMYMRTDRRFGVEGIETLRLIPPAVVDQYLQSTGADSRRWAARAQADSAARSGALAGKQEEAAKGEDQRQIRRCVESGRSEMQCVMEGFGKGVMGLVGAVMPGLKTPVMHGIRMSGEYSGEGRFGLTFSNESVSLNCGDLVQQSHPYTMLLSADGMRISIASQPRPILLMVRGEGSLVGPGPTEIAGQIITGYQQGIRTWSDGHTEPISRPIYADATRRCTIGALGAGRPSFASGSMATATVAVLGTLMGSADKDAPKPAPAGMRMNGEYGAQSSFDLEFLPEAVVVGCRDAVVLRPYTVQVQGGHPVIGVQNGAAPFTVTLGPDGALTGSGAVRVDGRVVTGSAPDGGIAYAPRSATCNLGGLAPAGPQLTEAEMGAAAARASMGGAGAANAQPTGALGPAASSMTMPAPGAGAAFQLENGLPVSPGSGNPLTGQTFFLLDASLDQIIKDAGVAQPTGLSAARLLEHDCSTAAGMTDCDKLIKAMKAHQVAVLRPDQTGVAQSPDLPVGKTYYLFGAVISGARKYTWHLPLAAKAGWTKITLNQANVTPP